MWIIIPIFLLILCWFLLAPLRFVIDTRIPIIFLRWFSIGQASIVYENEKWLFKISVLFFYKQWTLEKFLFNEKKTKRVKKVRKRRNRKKFRWLKMLNVLKTFRITKYEIAIDTGDQVMNAWLYPLNFYTGKHLHINFFGENYVMLEIRNTPWRLVYAFIK